MADSCSVCLEPMILECEISATPCTHPFHIICIKNLLPIPLYLVGSKPIITTVNKIKKFNKRFGEKSADSPDFPDSPQAGQSNGGKYEVGFEDQNLVTENEIDLNILAHIESTENEIAYAKMEEVENIKLSKWTEDFVKSPEYAYLNCYYQILKPDFVTVSSTLEDPITASDCLEDEWRIILNWKIGKTCRAQNCIVWSGQTQAGHSKTENVSAEVANDTKFSNDSSHAHGSHAHAEPGHTHASHAKAGNISSEVVQSRNDPQFSIDEMKAFEKEVYKMRFDDKRLKMPAILELLNSKYFKLLDLKITI